MQRQSWPDIAKGIAIILVVYGHAVRGLVVSGQIDFDGTGWEFVDYLIYSTHMPVFFVISGYFFDPSFAKGGAQFAKDRFKTVVWPYFLWSALHLAAQYLGTRLNLVNNAVDGSQALNILWEPISPFWFLYALAASLAISALLKRVNPLLIAVFCAGALICLQWVRHPEVIGDIIYGLAYFSLGRAVRRYDLLPGLGKAPIVTTAVIFAGCVVVGYRTGTPVRLDFPAALAGLLLVFLVASRLPSESRAAETLGMLGQYSMGVFVMHVTVIVAVRAICMKYVSQDPYVIVALQTLVGLILPVLAQYIANRLGIARYLGLQVNLSSRVKGAKLPSAVDGLSAK